MTRHLLIVSHNPSPNMQALTDAVVRGATDAEVNSVSVRVRRPFDADDADVLWSEAIILGTTANFGYMSGALKDFFDRIYYPCLEKTEGLPYALFVKGGHDPTGARTSVESIVTGLRWRAVHDPLMMTGTFTEDWLRPCEELGMAMAAGLEMGIY